MTAPAASPLEFPLRRPVAILAADVAGYARLMDAAEEDTHSRFMALRVRLIDPTVVSFRGRIVKNTGDGFLCYFETPRDALECALEILRQVSIMEAPQAEDRKIQFRIGLNFGEVIFERDDIFGTDVNIAARLQEIARPGGLVCTAAILEELQHPPDTFFDDLGEVKLKNISRQPRAYAVRAPGIAGQSPAELYRRFGRRADLPTIAVLPFERIGGTTEDDYFGQGLVEDIINSLATLRDVVVIARASTVNYLSAGFDLRKVGRDLGVRYVLTGTVRRSADRLRLTTQLNDVETHSTIWAERFDRDPRGLFEVQDEISARIVGTIAPHIQQAELRRSLGKRTDSIDAYDYMLRGLDLLKMEYAPFVRSRFFIEKAIEEDETYGMPHAYLSLWHVFNVGQGWSSDPAADAAAACASAATAIARDPNNPLGLALYGHVRSFLYRDYAVGRSHLDRAVEVCPNHAMAWALSSANYSYVGDLSAAVDHAQRALRLSPIDRYLFFYRQILGMAYYVSGHFAEALTWSRRVYSENPHFSANLRLLIATLVAIGRYDEAREMGDQLLKTEPRFRLSEYEGRCPFQDARVRGELLSRLRRAGLPD